jgi:hypothetical protein
LSYGRAYFIGYLMMISVSDGRMIDEELERNSKEAVMAQLVLSWHLPGGTE